MGLISLDSLKAFNTVDPSLGLSTLGFLNTTLLLPYWMILLRFLFWIFLFFLTSKFWSAPLLFSPVSSVFMLSLSHQIQAHGCKCHVTDTLIYIFNLDISPKPQSHYLSAHPVSPFESLDVSKWTWPNWTEPKLLFSYFPSWKIQPPTLSFQDENPRASFSSHGGLFLFPTWKVRSQKSILCIKRIWSITPTLQVTFSLFSIMGSLTHPVHLTDGSWAWCTWWI